MADLPDAGGGNQLNFFPENSGNGRRDLSQDVYNPPFKGDHTDDSNNDDQGDNGNPLFDDAYPDRVGARATDAVEERGTVDKGDRTDSNSFISALYVNSQIESHRPIEPLENLAQVLNQNQEVNASSGWQPGLGLQQQQRPLARVGYGDYYQGRQGFNDSCWGTGHRTCPPIESRTGESSTALGVTFGNERYSSRIPHYLQQRRQGA